MCSWPSTLQFHLLRSGRGEQVDTRIKYFQYMSFHTFIKTHNRTYLCSESLPYSPLHRTLFSYSSDAQPPMVCASTQRIRMEYFWRDLSVFIQGHWFQQSLQTKSVLISPFIFHVCPRDWPVPLLGRVPLLWWTVNTDAHNAWKQNLVDYLLDMWRWTCFSTSLYFSFLPFQMKIIKVTQS